MFAFTCAVATQIALVQAWGRPCNLVVAQRAALALAQPSAVVLFHPTVVEPNLGISDCPLGKGSKDEL